MPLDENVPLTYQDVMQVLTSGSVQHFELRQHTIKLIEKITDRLLICYVAQTDNTRPNPHSAIENDDLIGFNDLLNTTQSESVDILVMSNGGSAEATERIVKLLRSQFKNIRFIVPENAFSAATLLCFSGNEILMNRISSLGPIDPQINGIPARSITKAFQNIEERLKQEGPRALTAYMPLLSKYDLHLLEICKNADDLSKNLAKEWLSGFMLMNAKEQDIDIIVDFFSNYEDHKSHGRSIGRDKAREIGLKIIFTEELPKLDEYVRSLCYQYKHFFTASPFYKIFENARGINWGRNSNPPVNLQFPIQFPIPMLPQQEHLAQPPMVS